MGLFSKEKISKGVDKQGKSEEKRLSGEAYNINKQTIYIAPKSKIKSTAHYAPESAQGTCSYITHLKDTRHGGLVVFILHDLHLLHFGLILPHAVIACLPLCSHVLLRLNNTHNHC